MAYVLPRFYIHALYTTAYAYHQITADMAGISGFEIKRQEKYFVFIWMSRKERVIAEKTDHLQSFDEGRITGSRCPSWSKAMAIQIINN
jgi:hypothetical protein